MFFRLASETSSSLMSSIPTASASFTHTTLHLKATLLKRSLCTPPHGRTRRRSSVYRQQVHLDVFKTSKPRLSPEILFDETLFCFFFQLFNPNSLGCAG